MLQPEVFVVKSNLVLEDTADDGDFGRYRFLEPVNAYVVDARGVSS